ncbi:MAG: hypothetical protein HKN73_19750 [Gemmatimonadetes bacterium]|nr:hypothetical protein [Gemmatimonadota bacterium]
MRIDGRTVIGLVCVAGAVFGAGRYAEGMPTLAEGAPRLAEALNLPAESVRLVFFQPADCAQHRKAIVDEIVQRRARPVVLYADPEGPVDLGRLLSEEVSGVEALRLPDLGFENAFRRLGIDATPFVLSLDHRGAIVGDAHPLGWGGR